MPKSKPMSLLMMPMFARLPVLGVWSGQSCRVLVAFEDIDPLPPGGQQMGCFVRGSVSPLLRMDD